MSEDKDLAFFNSIKPPANDDGKMPDPGRIIQVANTEPPHVEQEEAYSPIDNGNWVDPTEPPMAAAYYDRDGERYVYVDCPEINIAYGHRPKQLAYAHRLVAGMPGAGIDSAGSVERVNPANTDHPILIKSPKVFRATFKLTLSV